MSRCAFPLRAERCWACGGVRLGGPVTEDGQLAPHAATAPGTAARAAYPGPWPTCRHEYFWRADCRNRPVPPACCAHPPCALVPPALPSPSDTRGQP